MYINDYTKDELNRIETLINEHHFLLLKGSLGVGKTLYAKIVANKLIERISDYEKVSVSHIGKLFTCSNGQIELISFNKGTSYENFVHGISVETEDDSIIYDNRKRIFLEMVEKASNDSTNNYVLILDDINRSDFSRAMGDILSAIETSGNGQIIRAGGQEYRIPDNLYIIATYNPTIGNAVIDYAWLRRFYVFEILSDERHIETEKEYVTHYRIGPEKDQDSDSYDAGFESANDEAKLKDYIFEIYMHMKIMFERYFTDPDVNIRNSYMLGHGMFLTLDKYDEADKDWLKRNFDNFNNQLKHCIVPILYQYIIDGLIDEEARFDVEVMEHLWDEEWGEITLTIKNNLRSSLMFYFIDILLNIENKVPVACFYLMFLHGISLRRAYLVADTDVKSLCFLFEKDSEKYKYQKNLHRKEEYFEINEIKFHVFSHHHGDTPIKDELFVIEEQKNGQIDLVYLAFTLIKLYIRVCGLTNATKRLEVDYTSTINEMKKYWKDVRGLSRRTASDKYNELEFLKKLL